MCTTQLDNSISGELGSRFKQMSEAYYTFMLCGTSDSLTGVQYMLLCPHPGLGKLVITRKVQCVSPESYFFTSESKYPFG